MENSGKKGTAFVRFSRKDGVAKRELEETARTKFDIPKQSFVRRLLRPDTRTFKNQRDQNKSRVFSLRGIQRSQLSGKKTVIMDADEIMNPQLDALALIDPTKTQLIITGVNDENKQALREKRKQFGITNCHHPKSGITVCQNIEGLKQTVSVTADQFLKAKSIEELLPQHSLSSTSIDDNNNETPEVIPAAEIPQATSDTVNPPISGHKEKPMSDYTVKHALAAALIIAFSSIAMAITYSALSAHNKHIGIPGVNNRISEVAILICPIAAFALILVAIHAIYQLRSSSPSTASSNASTETAFGIIETQMEV